MEVLNPPAKNISPSIGLSIGVIILGILVGMVGLMVMVGSVYHLSAIIPACSFFFDMGFNVAGGLFLGGIGLVSIYERNKRLSWLAGAALILLSGSVLVEYTTGWALGIGHLFIKNYAMYGFNSFEPMSPQVALCFFAFGVGLLVDRAVSQNYIVNALCRSSFGAVLFFMGGAGIFAQIFHVPFAFTWGAYNAMGMSTAIGFVLLGLGFILVGFHSLYLSLVIIIMLGITLAEQAYQGLVNINQAQLGIIIPPIIQMLILLLTAITVLYIYTLSRRSSLIEKVVEQRTEQFREANESLKKEVVIRQNAEQKALDAMRVRSEFISMVSHELRTPLAVIKESIALVYDQIAGPISADQKDFLETAKRNVDRLTRLINEVLDNQKMESGRMEYKMEINSINKIVKEAAESYRLSLSKQGLNLDLRLEENLPDISFDKDKIIQVLINFLNNAMKFSEQGTVTVSSQRIGDNVIRVSVADQGIGIKAEDMDKLFKNFSQISTGYKRKAGGTGLGLALSKSIIDYHRGKIGVSSDFGKGSTFYFILPIIDRRR